MYDEEPYEQETSFIIYEGMVVPESVLLKRERSNQYGSVEGLPDEELADPEELERQIYREELGSVMMLPQPMSKNFNPGWDWSVDVDFNAFASVDFDRTQPEFDKIRYKADKLRAELKDVLIIFDTVRTRIASKAKDKILKYVEMGIIDVGHIPDFDMYCLAELYLRARRKQNHIDNLIKLGRAKKAKRWEEFWSSFG